MAKLYNQFDQLANPREELLGQDMEDDTIDPSSKYEDDGTGDSILPDTEENYSIDLPLDPVFSTKRKHTH